MKNIIGFPPIFMCIKLSNFDSREYVKSYVHNKKFISATLINSKYSLKQNSVSKQIVAEAENT